VDGTVELVHNWYGRIGAIVWEYLEGVVMKLLPALVGEAIGVFGLSFVGILAIHQFNEVPSNGGLVGVALAHGVMLAIMVTAFMNVSGGHINPAVTIGLLAGGKIKPLDAVLYVAAQVFGGMVAGLAVVAIFGHDEGLKILVGGTPAFHTDASNLKALTVFGAFLAELIATFFLVIAVWGTAVDPRAPKVGGFAIGLTVGVDILAIGPMTGGAMNPARAMGPAIAAMIGGDMTVWANHWIYWAGPVAGGVLATVIYKGLILPKENA
jgi:MIP family channel proteins